MVKSKIFHFSDKDMNFRSNNGGVSELNDEESRLAEAAVGILSAESGVYRVMFFRNLLQLLCYMSSFLCFFLVIPFTVSKGKEYGLLFLSLCLFFMFCPLCFGF